MEYIRYMIKNVEPLRIADDSTSQSGQTMTLRYIPGTTIRGFVINHIASSMGEQFEQYKKVLFSDQVRYMNAYICVNDKELIPTPKGFYEDKTKCEKKPIQNVVIGGAFDNGFKRAEMGRYCYIEDDSIYHYSVRTGSDLKIKIQKPGQEKQEVFRHEYMESGNIFVGYIVVENSDVTDMIMSAFAEEFIIGNGRSQGLGKCQLIDKQIVSSVRAYEEYAIKGDAEKSVYMMLLSHTTMRNSVGEYCGIDLDTLQRKLDVQNLRIDQAATSVIDVKGYNRTWGIKIPSVTMYEFGSVFKLSFDGVITKDKLEQVMGQGIGVRRNEGFGQILFLNNYEQVQYKQTGACDVKVEEAVQTHSEDQEVLMQVARIYYRKLLYNAMQERVLSGTDRMGISKSKVGNVRAQLEANRYDPIKGTQIINDYFAHEGDKENKQNKQVKRVSIQSFARKILGILDTNRSIQDILELSIQTVMTIPVATLLSKDEEQRLKFEYVLDLIKYENRKGDK